MSLNRIIGMIIIGLGVFAVLAWALGGIILIPAGSDAELWGVRPRFAGIVGTVLAALGGFDAGFLIWAGFKFCPRLMEIPCQFADEVWKGLEVPLCLGILPLSLIGMGGGWLASTLCNATVELSAMIGVTGIVFGGLVTLALCGFNLFRKLHDDREPVSWSDICRVGEVIWGPDSESEPG